MNESRTIYLHSGEPVLVDHDDFPLVAQHKWRARRDPHMTYAIAHERQADGSWRTLLMHRLILGRPAGKVDHRNRDGLDNRRSNLRLATSSQNCANSRTWGVSQYKGVGPDGSRWRARGRTNGRSVRLGSFATQEEAARAYDAWARDAHGEFAYLNFPPAVS